MPVVTTAILVQKLQNASLATPLTTIEFLATKQ